MQISSWGKRHKSVGSEGSAASHFLSAPSHGPWDLKRRKRKRMSYGLHTLAKRMKKEGVPYSPEHDTPTPPEAEWHSAEEDLRNSGARDVGGRAGGLPMSFF